MNRTAEQLMDVESIANWLEQQPKHGTYRYWSTTNCLLGRYYQAKGFPYVRVGPSRLSPYAYDDDLNLVEIPDEVHKVIYGGPRLFRTFGGALKRARRLLNKENQVYALQEAGAR